MTEEPRTREDLLRRQREGRAQWEALLAPVPDARMAESGVKGWRSVKDIVAHIAAWERYAVRRLEPFLRGEAPEPLPPPGMTSEEYEHAFNAAVDETWRQKSWEEVRAEAEAAYARFLAVAEALPDAILFAADRPAWKTIAYNGYLHYLDFADYIRAWLGDKG